MKRAHPPFNPRAKHRRIQPAQPQFHANLCVSERDCASENNSNLSVFSIIFFTSFQHCRMHEKSQCNTTPFRLAIPTLQLLIAIPLFRRVLCTCLLSIPLSFLFVTSFPSLLPPLLLLACAQSACFPTDTHLSHLEPRLPHHPWAPLFFAGSSHHRTRTSFQSAH